VTSNSAFRHSSAAGFPANANSTHDIACNTLTYVFAEMGLLPQDAGHVLTANVAPGVTLLGDQELLTQAAANLVENALRHTPAGTRIILRLSGNRRTGIELSAEDDGPGVAAEDLPRLVHRFYRGERSRTTPGNGLGLSLVSAVADLHGASLLLEAGSPGLRATLRFPAAGAGR